MGKIGLDEINKIAKFGLNDISKMKKISYDEFKKTDGFKKFQEENPTVGKLKIQAFTADQAVPIPGLEVSIVCKIDDQLVEFFSGVTDENGMIDNIELPSPNGSYKEVAQEAPKSRIYHVVAKHPDYETPQKYVVTIYGGIKAIQYVKLCPKVILKDGKTGNEQC